MEHDIAIIGGGPAGYNAAEKAATNGLKTILFEKNAIGGVCLNEGCIPTKTLLYSAKTLDNIKGASKYGISVEGEPAFDLPKIISRKDKVVKKLTAGVSAKLNFNGVTVVQGTATIQGEENGLFRISSGDNTYSVKYILLCTGSETIIPPIKGLSDIDYWTSKEALEIKELPKSLAIIGGGVIGIEFASFFNSMGVKVTVVEMMPEILGIMDKETSAMLRSDYSKKGVTFKLNTKVTEVTNKGVVVEKDGKTETIEADRILVSVGRRPIIKGFGLENLNIELFRNGVKVNEYMQTSNPRVYAAGDITGFSLLAHTAIREGEVAISHIVGEDDKMSYKAIPGVVYTNPELAGVGMTEEELTAKGESFRVLKLPMAYAGRFVAENELGNGLCKIIVDDNDTIIGCHMLGNPASELIVIAGIAISNGDTVEEFRKHVYPHPTVSEIIHETLFS
ncbi:dihydrolipoyl dehydrogenase [Prevotella sp. 10(H)]|uniref:dihydrolipoyl dehydrogenase n=1 Tax=Prevotella sp. 10(H) TaxID=1158294 RepID=UPI0004A74BCB|nr:dihydrolipoyl dehydrogenase [Prevotella sp. 10(H)]